MRSQQEYRFTRILFPLSIEVGDRVTKNMGHTVKLETGAVAPASTEVILSSHGRLSSRPHPCGGSYRVVAKGTEQVGKKKIPYVDVIEN